MTPTKQAGKIHFIHQLEKSYVPANLGDWIASPYYYFPDFFQKYTCVLHSTWAILWHEIESDDIVIFGGGGLIDNSNSLNQVLNRLLDKCKNVIVWGAGSHKYSHDNVFGIQSSSVPVKFEKAAMVGIRDYKHPYNLPFLPCASCLHPAFDLKDSNIQVKRRVGAMKHGLDSTFGISGVPSFITNSHSITEIARYILESETMIVTSYHGAFWSMLLGRKVIVLESRKGIEKYRYFKYPVAFCKDNIKYDEEYMTKIASELPDLPDFLKEARKINLEFFEKVKVYIQDRLATRDSEETIQLMAKRLAQLEFTLIDLRNDFRSLGRRLSSIESEPSQ
jgi:hypothetical protein